MTAFATRLERERTQRKMTKQDFSQLLGIHPGMYNNYTNHDSFPRKDTIAKLADILECPVEDLLGLLPGKVKAKPEAAPKAIAEPAPEPITEPMVEPASVEQMPQSNYDRLSRRIEGIETKLDYLAALMEKQYRK